MSIIKQVYVVTRSLEHDGTSAKLNVSISKSIKSATADVENARSNMSMAQVSLNAAKLAYESAKAKKIEAIKNEKKLEENMTTAREKYKEAKLNHEKLVSRKDELIDQKNTLDQTLRTKGKTMYSSLRKTVSVGSKKFVKSTPENTYLVKRDQPKKSK